MAKVSGPLFSLRVSGTIGEIVFDRRGFAYLKKGHRDAKTTRQGSYRQAMIVAQRGVKLCGPQTRQALKAATTTSTWHGYLMKNIIGPQQSHYRRCLQNFNDPAVDQAGWEAAAASIGLLPLELAYAEETIISAGAQLFSLASTLFSLGLYRELGQPGGNAAAWQAQIVS